jgi:hypothetical protein
MSKETRRVGIFRRLAQQLQLLPRGERHLWDSVAVGGAQRH